MTKQDKGWSVAKSSSRRGQGGQLWRADWFVGVLGVLAVLFLHGWNAVLGALAHRYHDLASTRTSHQPSERMANAGSWPWPRDVHALLNPLPDVDGALRQAPLPIRHDGHAASALMLPQFYRDRDGRPAFALSLSGAMATSAHVATQIMQAAGSPGFENTLVAWNSATRPATQ